MSQWGGWSHDLAAAQDWSPYEGFSFWVKGAGSGQKIFFEVGSAAHRAVARAAAAKSQVLLKNDGGLLPLRRDAKVYVAGRTLNLAAADRAAIDKVCGAMKCVVLVVSGRPLLLGDLSGVEAVVASWLPGTEGDGVADPLFGAVPYTGRLPFTWFRSVEQLPINVGDAAYDPLWPYGWGLRTDRPRDRLKAARDRLASGDGPSKAAAAVLTLSGRGWSTDGSVRDARAVLAALGTAAALLERSKTDTYAVDDAVVSVARDLAQSAGKRPDLQASADHELAAGNLRKAVDLLAQAAR